MNPADLPLLPYWANRVRIVSGQYAGRSGTLRTAYPIARNRPGAHKAPWTYRIQLDGIAGGAGAVEIEVQHLEPIHPNEKEDRA